MKSTTPSDIASADAPVVVPSSPYNFIGSVQSGPVRLMTLVAPRIVVGAAHYQRENPLPPGCTIKFWPDVNTSITAILKSSQVIEDIELFVLDRNVNVQPIGIASLEMISLKNTFFAAGLLNVMQEAKPILGPAVFQFISGNQARFKQSPTATVENGDSGAPDLVKVGGSLFLVGPHYSNQGPNTFWLTSIMAKYATVISALG